MGSRDTPITDTDVASRTDLRRRDCASSGNIRSRGAVQLRMLVGVLSAEFRRLA